MEIDFDQLHLTGIYYLLTQANNPGNALETLILGWVGEDIAITANYFSQT